MNSSSGAILAVDPGRDKCGVAVVTADGRPVAREIVPANRLGARAAELACAHRVSLVVVGDRTGADTALDALQTALPEAATVTVDEHRSTEEARRLYFHENPPRGWRRLLPQSLLTPPVAYDDYVAVILARRHLRCGAAPSS